jgi:hypothetical protein
MRVLAAVVLMATGAVLTSGFSLAAPNQESLQTPAVSVPSTCPVTKPTDRPFVPPAPYPSEGTFWIGNEQLWTDITADGIWNGLPHYTAEDSRFRQKLFWWHEGYDWRNENPPELKVTGTRLDAPAPLIETDEHANAGWTNDRVHPFMGVGIFIPTVGCWKIKGDYKGEELSYVVWLSDSCTPDDLLAIVKPDDPAYADAMNLARTLQAHGFIVKCVLQSKMIHIFEGQKGAALFRTDHGDFEALFLPTLQTFASVELIEWRENDRFLYSFRGSPPPTSLQPIDSAYPMFFDRHANQFFVTANRQLVASIAIAVR